MLCGTYPQVYGLAGYGVKEFILLTGVGALSFLLQTTSPETIPLNHGNVRCSVNQVNVLTSVFGSRCCESLQSMVIIRNNCRVLQDRFCHGIQELRALGTGERCSHWSCFFALLCGRVLPFADGLTGAKHVPLIYSRLAVPHISLEQREPQYSSSSHVIYWKDLGRDSGGC